MKHQVYQGQYTLSHWIDLILSKNIVLPDYQRNFVWSKKQVEEFMASVKKDQFIPPITIGLFKCNGENVNYILDGQQRLTSILLTKFKKYPLNGKNKAQNSNLMDENDDLNQEDAGSVLKWTFKNLTDIGNTYDEVCKNFGKDQYEEMNSEYSESDYDNHYLNFCYIVPGVKDEKDEKEQQNFYASVFRNINIKGQTLNEIESREALYFLNQPLTPFFKTKVGEYYVKTATNKNPIDFVRYMAFLSQYHVTHNVEKVAVGYGGRTKIEEYYEEYIYETIGEKGEGMFADFNAIFPNGKYEDRIRNLNTLLSNLQFPVKYKTIIAIDTYFFGLLYYRLILNQNIDYKKREEIKKDLDGAIKAFKRSKEHVKSPASLKYLRKRIDKSIKIYSKYATGE